MPALIANEFNGQGSLLAFHLLSFSAEPITYPSLRPAMLNSFVRLLITIKFL